MTETKTPTKTMSEQVKNALIELKTERDRFRTFEVNARIRFKGLLATGHIVQPKDGKHRGNYHAFVQDETSAKTKFELAMTLLNQAYVHADNALFAASWDRDMLDQEEKERLEKILAENEEIRMK